MDKLKIERRGGFAGLKARGEVDVESLSEADRAALDELFSAKGEFPASRGADRFTFTVTRETDSGAKTVEIPEHLLPSAIARAVKDELPK